MNNIIIRPLVPNDVLQTVRIHLKSFPNFFLSFLGPSFLGLLYRSLLDDSAGIVLVACSDLQINGFVAGVTEQAGFYQRLIKRQKWLFAGAALKAVVRRPAIIPRLLRALRRPQESAQSSAPACLMSLAVIPEAQGKGIGRKLVEAFCQELKKRQVGAFCLTTDRDDNERTNRFYQQFGFELARCFITQEGRAMNEYLLRLHQ